MVAERASVPFIDSLRASGLLTDAQLAELAKCPEARDLAPAPLARVIFQRGWLTRFQLNMIAAGSAKGLTVGPYTILDRIGEGGMGTIYKARHQHMQRLVALKVIRKERLASADAVKRFYQEVEMAATLHHPNIVLAYDAGQSGPTHYFAMEYIDGVDLARLVKEKGPLPVAQACDYIRQIAVGLQHAHEKGLVHRDVKPSNMLLSRGAKADVVKLLDMGLARVQGGVDTGLTKIGAVLGTPDFLSPEQAMNSKSADIRADLYSLGCSLFYLLIGKPPFIANELTEVLLKHQMEKPVPLAEQGVDAPKKVQAILDRLMAKHPDQRYQTPDDLIEDLEPFCRATTDAGHIKAAKEQPTDNVQAQKEQPTEDWATMARDDTAEKEAPNRSAAAVRPSRRKPVATDPSRHKKRLLLIGIGGAALLVLGLVLFLALRSDKPDSVTEGPKPSEPVKGPPTEKSETGKAPQSTHKRADPDGDKPKPDHPPDDPPTVALRLPLTLPFNITNAAAFSPDGKRVVLGVGALWLWDIAANKRIHDFGGVQYSGLFAVAWSADGRRVLAGGLAFYNGKNQGAATLHEADTGKLVQTFIGDLSAVSAVALSPDGLRVLTATGKHRIEGGIAVKGPDGKFVYDDTGLHLWDATTGKDLGTYLGPAGPTKSLAFAPDGKSFFAAGAPTQMLRFAIDGKTSFIAGGPDEGAAFIWEVDSKKMRRLSFPEIAIDYAVLSPNGREIVYAGADQAVHFVTVKDGKETRRSVRYGRPPTRTVWSRDGRYIAFGSVKTPGAAGQPPITLMSAADAQGVLTISGHENNTITMLAISDDGRLILASSFDGTRLWELSAKKP